MAQRRFRHQHRKLFRLRDQLPLDQFPRSRLSRRHHIPQPTGSHQGSQRRHRRVEHVCPHQSHHLHARIAHARLDSPDSNRQQHRLCRPGQFHLIDQPLHPPGALIPRQRLPLRNRRQRQHLLRSHRSRRPHRPPPLLPRQTRLAYLQRPECPAIFVRSPLQFRRHGRQHSGVLRIEMAVFRRIRHLRRQGLAIRRPHQFDPAHLHRHTQRHRQRTGQT